MGALYLIRDDDRAGERLDAARAQFARHGFGTTTPIGGAGFTGFHAAPFHGGPDSFHADGDDVIAVAGTLSYDRKLGRPALSALLRDFQFPYTDWTRLHGQFILFVRKNGRAYLLTDYFAAFQLFHDADHDMFSTSFLAAAKSLDRVSFQAQGVYEFAFNVFPTGNDTVLRELQRLGPRRQLELGQTVKAIEVEKPLPETATQEPLQDRVERTATQLRALIAPFAEYYGDKIQCPLSGGLDSRLALSLLRDAGVRPHVYVYGAPHLPDVQIAKKIAEGEGFDFEIFEKAKHARITPDDFAETVERNFHETDALVTDGGLFDNGGNAEARHARQRNGQLAVSGGCGEVFRNFFYLADRRMTARDVVGAFFARYTQGDVVPDFDADRFLGNLEAKALRAVGEQYAGDRLPRPVIEQLYPRMRCRSFFGREISLVGRQGGYLMPFFDHQIVAAALTLPISLKNAGKFESALLVHIDPKLASYPSTYGYSFDTAPTYQHRMSEFGTRVRPPWMRKHSYALRRRLGPIRDEQGGLLTPAYLGRVLDLHFPHMSRYFRVPNIEDNGLYRRVATLEYLAQHLEGRLG
jgi:asparagine synthase (glutamine-hydrolysing)|tara:strand:- start:112051 stop:113790 length:1740 start_codon:yes stop_codon:yes gene_type:complete